MTVRVAHPERRRRNFGAPGRNSTIFLNFCTARLWKTAAQHDARIACNPRTACLSSLLWLCCWGCAAAVWRRVWCTWRCGSVLPRPQSTPRVQLERAAATAGALAASRRRHAFVPCGARAARRAAAAHGDASRRLWKARTKLSLLYLRCPKRFEARDLHNFLRTSRWRDCLSVPHLATACNQGGPILEYFHTLIPVGPDPESPPQG